MTIKDIAFKSEDVDIKTWELASMTLAINDAIFNGSLDQSAYEGAFFALMCLARDVQTESEALTKALFDMLKLESQAVSSEEK